MGPFLRRAENLDEEQKQDQSGILAQNFLSCEKVRLEFLRDFLFSTRLAWAVKCRDGNCRADCAVWLAQKSWK
jgi:hypothetical protein